MCLPSRRVRTQSASEWFLAVMRVNVRAHVFPRRRVVVTQVAHVRVASVRAYHINTRRAMLERLRFARRHDFELFAVHAHKVDAHVNLLHVIVHVCGLLCAVRAEVTLELLLREMCPYMPKHVTVTRRRVWACITRVLR